MANIKIYVGIHYLYERIKCANHLPMSSTQNSFLNAMMIHHHFRIQNDNVPIPLTHLSKFLSGLICLDIFGQTL